MKHGAPRVALRFLAMVVPPDVVGRSMIGDLLEEWSARPAGVVRNVWFAWETVCMAVHFFTRAVVSSTAASALDLRRAVLSFLRSPVHSALAVVTLGLGIAAPTIMFSIGVGLTRDLEVPGSESLIHIGRRYTPTIIRGAELDWLRPLLSGVAGLESLAPYGTSSVDLSDGDAPPERRDFAAVTPSLFHVLRTDAMLGRTLAESDVGRASRSAVIGAALWRDRFGSDASVLGRVVRLDGHPYEVVGVMPEAFDFPRGTSLWIPLNPGALPGEIETYEVVGRLESTAGITAVEGSLAAVTQALRDAGHDIHPDGGLAAQPLRARLAGAYDPRLLGVMQLLVALILIMACGNVVSLLLVRAIGRRHETSVMVAIGASRWRLARQQLMDASLLAGMGGLVALLLTRAAMRAFDGRLAAVVGPWVDVRLDHDVFVFGLVLVTAVAFVTGLTSVAAAVAPRAAIGGGPDSSASSTLRVVRLNRAIVTGAVAMCFSLLVGAGIMTRGALASMRTDGAYETEGILTARYDLRSARYDGDDEVVDFHERMVASLRDRTTVRHAALASHLPGTYAARRRVEIEGVNLDGERTHEITVSPGFFRTMGTELERGRDFTWSDGRPGSMTVVVNQAFVERFLPGVDPIGKRLRLSSFRPDAAGDIPWAEIVGVSPPLGIAVGRETDGSAVYVPVTALAERRMVALVIPADPTSVGGDLRSVATRLDSDLALYDVAELDSHIRRARAPETSWAALFLAFGGTALLLAGVGLYGILVFGLRSRIREWGVRVAVGARSLQILSLIVAGGARELLLGLTIGAVLAATIVPRLGETLFGVNPYDPLVYAVVATTVLSMYLVATVLPARRAVSADVVTALRTG